jgi:hypothetical protein
LGAGGKEMDENSLIRAFRNWMREQIAKNWQSVGEAGSP